MSAAGINVRRICTDCSHSFGLQAPADAKAMRAMVMVVIKTKIWEHRRVEENLAKKIVNTCLTIGLKLLWLICRLRLAACAVIVASEIGVRLRG